MVNIYAHTIIAAIVAQITVSGATTPSIFRRTLSFHRTQSQYSNKNSIQLTLSRSLLLRVFLFQDKVRLTCIRPVVLTKKAWDTFCTFGRVCEEQQPRKKTPHYYVCIMNRRKRISKTLWCLIVSFSFCSILMAHTRLSAFSFSLRLMLLIYRY